MLIEIIVTTLDEAITAEKYGANRLELIDSFASGGLSPDLELTKSISNRVAVPVNIMLRPHGNSFLYTKSDMAQVMSELDYIRDNTCANGVVFGALDNSGNINTQLLEQIIANLGHLQLTFHRAIDSAANVLFAYQTLLEYPDVDLVLTSGGKNTALEGINIIKQMVEMRKNSEKSNAVILAGSGITPDNVKSIVNTTQVEQVHLGQGVREHGVLNKARFDKLLHHV